MSQNAIPSYRHHRASGLAVVTLCGKDHYLGAYGTPESLEAYRRVTAGWLANGPTLANGQPDPTVSDIVARFLIHADGYYRRDGRPTGETNGSASRRSRC